jgi:hypothetical protein
MRGTITLRGQDRDAKATQRPQTAHHGLREGTYQLQYDISHIHDNSAYIERPYPAFPATPKTITMARKEIQGTPRNGNGRMIPWTVSISAALNRQDNRNYRKNKNKVAYRLGR